ncbi:MAG TPA: hypothetical protein VLH80_05300 [Nitrospiraceae bacterium]|nr:hypothetical protein [Nitrospiraceae bacterium]
MNDQPYSKADLDGFHSAAQSLKLYRRAELESEAGHSLIESLYVDPLPNEHVYQTILKPNTTFIIGRKGTGKSTVFQRAQHGLRGVGNSTSAYVDIKTVFESSRTDSTLTAQLADVDASLEADPLRQLLLYQAFIRAVIVAIRDELKRYIKHSLWDRMTFRARSVEELFEGLDDLLADANVERFIDVSGVRTVRVKAKNDTEQAQTDSTSLEATASVTGPAVKASIGSSEKTRQINGEEFEYSQVLMRVFGIKEYIVRLKHLLNAASISRLYVFIDDFSELPEEAMKLVVDTILAPLNNWSEELVKFKVAAYPNRIYYGMIDKTKIDEVNLDLYDLYGTGDVSAMEYKAIDFTRRLVGTRLDYHCGRGQSFFVGEDQWRNLYYASMGNPRTLGYLLFYIYESHLLYGKPISVTAIRDAAKRYYEEKIESYFSLNKFLHESFSERSSIYSLKELLNVLVRRARDLRSHRSSEIMRSLSGRPPTSHFHVISEYDNLLSTLELNFFLTKYFAMTDRDGRKVSIYALNYGLCQKYTIEFGRPSDRREHRTYFIERIFDYTPLLQHYMATNQEIACEHCSTKYDAAQLVSLQLFGMMCPACRIGPCVVRNLSRRYEEVLRNVDANLLLPSTELGILNTLHTEHRPMYAGDIAADLDCSYQLVGRRGRFLDDRGLVERSESPSGRRLFQITDRAREAYFSRSDDDALDV